MAGKKTSITRGDGRRRRRSKKTDPRQQKRSQNETTTKKDKESHKGTNFLHHAVEPHWGGVKKTKFKNCEGKVGRRRGI